MDNYQILTKIYESTNSLVYRAFHPSNLHPVILKILKEDYPSPLELTRYKQEYEITHSLQVDGAIKVYELIPYKNTLAMVLEDFGGESLAILTQSQLFSLSEFLLIATQIAQALGEIHEANIIHKDINPSNIVFNPQTQQVKIIDFGISTKFTRENTPLKNPHLLEGTLAYMSPEQTGRMNRVLDRSTDFYSLGVTFYQLLTQKLPFATEDPLELVHCHIAKQPIAPHELNSEIPLAVSNIVMKLLAKTAEDRYQNASGLQTDLQECLRQLEQTGEILEFPLGRNDISDQLVIPQKLYGRKREVETLLATFQRVAQGTEQHAPEIIFVTGYSGIGKSVLVQELYKPITQQRGYFITGKFDQFQGNIPYSAIASAFKSLVQQLLTESDTELAQWREKLLAAFGANGQVIVDIIPEIEQIVGCQPPVQLLEPTETQNRFNTVFLNFLRVFCQKAHPLVIFLDDLQWADFASLKLLELILSDRGLGYLVCIGAYRDQEIESHHPLMKMRDHLPEEGIIINTIILNPLPVEEITQLIADALQQPPENVISLAELVHQKTSGNPFFINEFLKTIYQENFLKFNPTSKAWRWDLAEIVTLSITDNVIDLMIDKLRKLQPATQQALSLAACIGNRFDLTILSQICQRSAVQVFQDLLPAIQLSLIQPTSSLEITVSETPIESALIVESYQFQHDRVQQAAYALIESDRQQSVHLEIGKKLLANVSPLELGEKLFTLVDHLNKGRALLVSDREKNELAELNLKAGKKAKKATAYLASRDYLILAHEMFAGEIWQDHYVLAIDLYKQLAEIEYLNGNFEQSQALIQQSIQQAKSAMDRSKYYYLLIELYTMQGQYLQAIEVGKTALAELGIDFPNCDFDKAVAAELTKFREILGNRQVSSLIDSPEMEDPIKKIALELLLKMQPPTYLGAPELSGIVMSKSANLSLEYGHTSKSALSYSIFGALQAILGNYQLSYELTLLGYQLSKKFHDLYSISQTANALADFSLSWVKPIKQTEKLNAESIEAGLQSGMLQFVGFSMTHSLLNKIYQGKTLSLLPQEASRILPFCQKTKNQWSIDCILGQKIVLQNLLGQTQNQLYFACDEIEESDYLNQGQVKRTPNAICYYYIFKAQTLYLYGEWEQALTSIAKAEELSAFISGTIYASTYNFYHSLTLAALYPSVLPEQQQEYWTQIENNQAQMKNWANHCPENFLHKYLLVAAEMTRISGQWSEAINLYDQAIKLAKENEFIQEEAIANELAAQVWFGQEKAEFAQLHLKKARQCYQIWGAKRKVEDLDQKYPHWLDLSPKESETTPIKTVTTTGINSGKALDLAAVMKASQAISSEIILEELLKKLMKTVIESAGAQKGFLILSKDGNWVIEAEGFAHVEQVTAMQSMPIDTLSGESQIPVISSAIINYVARTQENVVLNDAAHEGAYTRDPYIAVTQPKSILCTPIIYQSQLIGLLYLENNLATGAFTDDRIEVLKLLSSQAAISIKNAQLYEQTSALNISLQQEVIERRRAEEALAESNRNLEFKIEERTFELKEAKEVADAANQAKSEFLSNMSHELRTPLNGILGYTQILQRSNKMPPEERHGISIIHQCGSHLLTLINDILDLSKIEARKMELYPTVFHFPSFLQGVAEICRIRAEQKGINFSYQTPAELPQRVSADEKRLRQVLINLIGNAVKFTDSGGVTFKIEIINRGEKVPAGSVALVRFQVEDTGIGMSPEQLNKIFLPFEQVSEESRKSEGTGLGLAISQSIIEMMGSTIQVRSQLNQGSVFWIDLELSEVEGGEVTTINFVNKKIISYTGSRRKILVVDDQQENRWVILNLLKPIGFEIAEAPNGKEGLEIAKILKPDLIILDLMMPGMNGFEMMRYLRQSAELKQVAIIASSARVYESDRAESLAAGANDFLPKPVQLDDLLEKLHRHLSLEWVYAETEMRSHSTSASQLATSLVAPPMEELAILFDLAKKGRIQGILEQADRIETLNEEFIPFANQIRQLAKQFKVPQLQHFVKKYIDFNLS